MERACSKIEESFSTESARIKKVADARERLHVAVGIFDIIDQAFKNGSNGKILFQLIYMHHY